MLTNVFVVGAEVDGNGLQQKDSLFELQQIYAASVHRHHRVHACKLLNTTDFLQ